MSEKEKEEDVTFELIETICTTRWIIYLTKFSAFSIKNHYINIMRCQKCKKKVINGNYKTREEARAMIGFIIFDPCSRCPKTTDKD